MLKSLLFSIILLGVLVGCSTIKSNPQKEPSCALQGPQLEELLSLDYKSFDQNLPNGGWRPLCHLEAGKVIDIYILHHMEILKDFEKKILYWHAGQTYAFEGLHQLALARFKQSYDSKENPDDPFKWNSYVRGTIAFLEHDLTALIKAKEELQTANINSKNNLALLEAFIRCFNKTYKEAYSFDCQK